MPAAEAALSLTIAELAVAYHQSDFKPLDVTEAAFGRIGRLDGRLNSFVTLTRELAMRQAQAAQEELARGVDRGPLQGVPIGLKDLYATRGIRTTAHSRVLLDWIPDEDATAVARLHAAGAVLLGKRSKVRPMSSMTLRFGGACSICCLR
jgi:Asp-tRNA(Asn)/Glu-tRNA(Gln) amidotransferase A subunit family amidase